MLRERSFGSVKIISLDREALLACLRASALHLRAAHPEVAEVRVFGSIARGDQTGTSDADVLIVVETAAERDWLTDTRRYLPYFDLPIGVDLFVLSRERLTARLAAGDASLRRAYQESLPL
jgi:predicted nucleotidyltransferase